MLALCSIVIAVLIGRYQTPPALAIAAALGMRTAFGLAMGIVIHFFKLEPFIVTLAGMFFARGLAQIIHIQAMPIETPFYSWISGFGFHIGRTQLPITAVIFVVMVAVGLLLLGFIVLQRFLTAASGRSKAS